ncbi:glycosyltransferase [Succinispira mobilis]|uniref:glycosyltransferase n=1 Tax=Succinispira mobilis TaxID=78120 RepID=UPI00036A8AE6|nr:glycosyltransferase [Succinispira mobilis]
MKILQLSTFDSGGGAARSACRLQKEFVKNNIDSRLYVQKKTLGDYWVQDDDRYIGKIRSLFAPHLENGFKKIFQTKLSKPFSLNIIPNPTLRKYIKSNNFDIVNLHWINGGFFRLEELDFKKKYIWTLHDSWAFTGGCHIPYYCLEYEHNCEKCAMLKNKKLFNLAKTFWKKKKAIYEILDMTVVAPSNWLAKCAQNSSLMNNKRIVVIPNGIDTSIYKPIEKKIAREILNLPENKKIICFGAISSTADENKGYNYLKDALKYLKTNCGNLDFEILIFGSDKPLTPENFGVPINYLGKVNDDYTLALVYSSADVFVAPSKSENLPNTVMESLACGRPVVAFDIGGMSDLIVNGSNGYLAKPYDAIELGKCLLRILLADNLAQYEVNARRKVVENFTIEHVARKYIDLYEEINI